MTTSKTPNLGLMSPTGSDTFLTSDFATTFGIIDTVPGVLTVANQASLPVGYGANQHGREVWQADQNITWVWNQPSGSPSGSWLRKGNKGWLAGSTNPNHITTSTSGVPGVVLVSFAALIPGGRPLSIEMKARWVANDHSGQISIQYYFNGAVQDTIYWSDMDTGVGPYPPEMKYWRIFTNPAPVTQQNITFQFNLVSPSFLGGGTAQCTGFTANVFEV